MRAGTTLTDAVREWAERFRPDLEHVPMRSLISINPRFCEWLMGLPRGWTDVDRTRSAIASCR
jgi:hypothetical protein